jgi:hypothetical protein
MQLTTLAVAWVLVTAWFLLWELLAGRLDARGNAGGWFRAPAQVYVAEALLVTLLGTLWFASLGAGGWWLVFPLLGVLMEWPGPVRHGFRAPDGSGRAAVRVTSGALRIGGAGALLWWWIG